MLRFSIFGFPVAVHWMFWVTTALIGGGIGATSRDQVLRMVFFIVAAFISVMIHELGHAFMMRRYGARAAIMLYAFGGMAAPDRGFTRGQGIWISLAGPLVQIAFGALVWILARNILLPNALAAAFIFYLIVISIVWGIFNLIPIYPMDGGQILYNSLGGSRARTTYRISMVLAAGLAIWLLTTGSIFGTILMGMMAYENFQRSQGLAPSSFLNPR